MQECAATRSDEDDMMDPWTFDSLDSDDLGLPSFALPQKRKDDLGKCYGCGAELQTQNPRTPGFITKETFEIKSRHRQRDSALCARYVPYCAT